jgi:Haem-degrading
MDLLALAKTIADRVEMAAARAEVPVAVSAIDTDGNVILKHRMRGLSAFPIELSQRKAYTPAWSECERSTCSPGATWPRPVPVDDGGGCSRQGSPTGTHIRQPNVNANVSTPESKNSISNCRSEIGPDCRIS